MKKAGLILGLVLILGACQAKPNQTVKEADAPENGVVTLVVDTGEKVATYSGQVNNSTSVLEFLSSIAEANAVDLETKVYDFGIMVESIGGKKNTAERAWIYFVNGQAGEVGAGEKQLIKGDVVEWKYITPIY